jgi:regulatory protein
VGEGGSTSPEPDERGDPEEPDADPHAVARTICLRLLTVRARTRAELATALAKKGVPDDVAADVLDRFSELRFIDDEAFAAAWVQSRHAGRGLGRRALTHELRKRGVADDVAKQAVAQLDEGDEMARARELVRRRLAGMAGVPAAAKLRRLTGMLARKGYSGGVALTVVREAIAGADDALETGSEELI